MNLYTMKTRTVMSFAVAMCAALELSAAPQPVDVPELMTTFGGEKVVTREQWEKVRAPEIGRASCRERVFLTV